MANIEIGDTHLECIERGRGEPVVFVHGSASDHRTWQSQLDAFGGRFRAIAYSRRYHWPNEPIPDRADYSMTEQADDLQALLRTLGAGPVHLIGHSYGGFVALLLAIREPGLLRTLVLAEPPVVTLVVSLPPRPLQMLRLLARRPRTTAAILKFAATGLAPATAAFKRDDMETGMRIFGTATLGRSLFQRLSEPRREQVRANLIKAELLGSGLAPLAAADLKRIKVPTLLVTGERSPNLFHRLTDRLQALLPNAERIEIRGASHLMHEEDPLAYNAAVLSFLERHRT